MSFTASQPENGLKAELIRIWQHSHFIREYVWKYRKLVLLGLGSLLLVDLLEIIPPILLKDSIDTVLEHRPWMRLFYLGVLYIGIGIIQGFCRYGWRMFLIRASFLSGQDLRNRFAGHLFGLSCDFFERRRVGDLLSLATNDTDAVRMAIGAGLLTLADALIYILIVPVAMILLSPRLTVVSLIPMLFVPWFVMRNERKLHERFEKVQESFSELSAMAQENLNGIRVIKAFASEDVQLGRFRKKGEEYIRLNLKLARVQSLFGPTLDFTMSMGLVTLLYFGGKDVISGALTLGTFVAFQRYIQKMIWPMTAVGLAITMFQKATASSGRIQEILELRSLVPDPLTPVAPRAIRGEIDFRHLQFSYPGSARSVLQDISLKIESGQRIALVGEIGSGKSSLLSLIPRIYPVDRGMLLIDGVDVNDWSLKELRRQVGYVGQDVFLFSQNVRENILFGLHEQNLGLEVEAAQEMAEQMAERAAVHEDARLFAQGYGTLLGERGVNLSGGQKQRLTIARALAKQPAILILDDALSSVDVQTEEKILKALRASQNQATELVAAHRISTIQAADWIMVLERGKLVQQGTHTSLLKEPQGVYWKFYEQQRLKEDLEQYVQTQFKTI